MSYAVRKSKGFVELKEFTADFASTINWKSNCIPDDYYFDTISVVLPSGKLDLKHPIMHHLLENLNAMTGITADVEAARQPASYLFINPYLMKEITGKKDIKVDELKFDDIMRYIHLHKDKLVSSTHTYRVIYDLLTMSSNEEAAEIYSKIGFNRHGIKGTCFLSSLKKNLAK